MAAKRVFKSKKKISGGRCVYRPWKEWEEGDLVIGTYTGSSTDNYDKTNWHLKVEDAQFSNAKEAKKLIGQTLGMNSMGMLNKAMEKIEEGTMIQVLFTGTSEIEKGKYAGKDSYVCEVDIVEEDNGDQDEQETDDENGGEDDDL